MGQHDEDFDSDSDLTPLEESDNEFDARPKVKLRMVSASLPEARQNRYSTESIYKAIKSGRIKLDPDYQRDVVWDEMQQSVLVNSILNNYGINQILFCVDKVERGGQMVDVKICIDGKQRLTSIFLFMEGEIPSLDPKTMELIWYKVDENDPSMRTRKVLDEESKITWNEKQIWCSEYETLTDYQQRELFSRVQMGMPLTLPETLQAVGSPRAQFISTLKKRIFHSSGFHSTCPSKWDISRGLDFQHTACVVYMISMYFHKEPAKDFEPAPKRLVPWLKEENLSIPEELAGPINTAVDIFLFLATSPVWKKIFYKAKRQFSGREFGSIACFIYHWMDHMTMDQLGRGIAKVRSEVSSKRALWKYLRDKKSWTKEVGEFVGTSARATIELLNPTGDSVAAPVLVSAPTTNVVENFTSTAPPAVVATTTSRPKRKLDALSDKAGTAASLPNPIIGESPKKRGRAVTAGARTNKAGTSKAASAVKVPDAPPLKSPPLAPMALTSQRPPKRKRNLIVSDEEDIATVQDGNREKSDEEEEVPLAKLPRRGVAGPDTRTTTGKSRAALPPIQTGVETDNVASSSSKLATALNRSTGRGSAMKSSAATRSKTKTNAGPKPELPPAIPRTGLPSSASSLREIKFQKISSAAKSPAISPQLPAACPSHIPRTITPVANSPKPPVSQPSLLRDLPPLKAPSPAQSQPPSSTCRHPLRNTSTAPLAPLTRSSSITPTALRPTTPLALGTALPEPNARQSPSIESRMQQFLPRGSNSPATTESRRFDRLLQAKSQANVTVASFDNHSPGLAYGHSVSPTAVSETPSLRIPDSVASARPQATMDPRRRVPPPLQIPPSMSKSDASSSSSTAVMTPTTESLQRLQKTNYFSQPVRQSPTIPQYGDNFSRPNNALPTPFRPSSANTMRVETPTSVHITQHTTLNASQLPPRLQPRDFPVGAGLPMLTPVTDPRSLWEQCRSPVNSASSSESDIRSHHASRPFLAESGSLQRPTGNPAGHSPTRDMKRKPSWERSQGRFH